MTNRPRARAGTPRWQAATEIEEALLEAVRNKDRRGYLRILATADLFHYVPKDYQDKRGGRAYFPTEDVDGSVCVVVRTVGERLPRRAQFVAVRTSLLELEAIWPGSRYTLHVNPGTPAFMRLTASALDRRRWRKTAAEATASLPTDTRPTRLLTKYTGPRTGPLAHALACGAHLSVANGVLWNEIGDVYDSYGNEVKTLREWWGTTTAHEWQEQLDALLEGRNSPPEPQFALDVRQQLALEMEGRGDGRVDTGLWRRTCTAVLADLQAPAEVEETVQELIGRILRYEARFRADGLLPPDGFVRSAVGYDYGRAVGFARWGLSARLCPFAAAEEAVLRAGELCHEAYRSWEDFSAGYALGRVLRFDTEEFGQWYTKVLEPHRILTKDAESPWRTIPWNSTSTV